MQSKFLQRNWISISAAVTLLVVSADRAFAAPSTGCAAASSGALSGDVASAGSLTRQLALDAGDIINVSLRTSQSATASVALIGGAGAPQTLIGNSSVGAVTFRAPVADTYVFRFAAAEGGSASVTVSCASVRVTEANAAFLARRKDLLNVQDPDRLRIDRALTPIANPDKPMSSSVALDDQGSPKQVGFSVSLSEIAAAAAGPGAKPQPAMVDLWLEGRMENYAATAADFGTSSGNLGVVYLGTKSMIGPDIMVGGLAQFDRGIETARYAPEAMAATGWMAGPYMSMKLGSGVVFDGRAAWGETQNDAYGIERADGQTDRRLVRAKLTGTREVEGWKVVPSVGVVYLEDAVRDSATGETKAAGTGKIEVLPEVSRRIEVNGDTFVEPRAALGGYFGFDEFTALSPATSAEGAAAADLHLKAEAGVALGVKDGSTLQATGGVESSATAVPETWTGRLQLNMPLNK